MFVLPSLILYLDKLIKNKEASKPWFSIEDNEDYISEEEEKEKEEEK